MGEVIHGDYSRWTGEDMLHSVTNYELHKGLYSGHNDHNYFEIAHTIRRQFDANGGIYRGRRLYSFVENHDVDRLVNKLNHKEHLIPVYTLLYTLPGIPSIYYGGEWGVEGKKEGANDDLLRPCLDLEQMEAQPPHPELKELLIKLAKLRKEAPALVDGVYRELLLTNRQYAFARILGEEAVVVAVNNDEAPARMEIPCPVAGSSALEILTDETFPIQNGKLQLEIPAGGSAVFNMIQE